MNATRPDGLNGEPVTFRSSDTTVETWLADLATVDRIHHHLGEQPTDGTTDPAVAALRRMRLHSANAHVSLRDTLRALPAGEPVAFPRDEMVDHATRWADALAQLAGAAPWFDHVWDALTATHRMSRTGPAKACEGCALPGERAVYISAYPGVADRVAVTCPACGRAVQHSYGEPAPDIEVRIAPGSGALTLTVDAPVGPGPFESSTVYLQVVPGSARRTGVTGRPPMDRIELDPGTGARVMPDLSAPLGAAGTRLQVLTVTRFRVSAQSIPIPAVPAVTRRPKTPRQRTSSASTPAGSVAGAASGVTGTRVVAPRS